MKIGDTVWVFDVNRREYTKPAPGRIWGDLIYRGHFRPVSIVGETKKSWVLNTGAKVNKKTLDGIFKTQSEINDAVFVHDHGHKISDAVRDCRDVETLRQIAAIVGYEPKR